MEPRDLQRANSFTIFSIDDADAEKQIEYFFASDARWWGGGEVIEKGEGVVGKRGVEEIQRRAVVLERWC